MRSAYLWRAYENGLSDFVILPTLAGRGHGSARALRFERLRLEGVAGLLLTMLFAILYRRPSAGAEYLSVTPDVLVPCTSTVLSRESNNDSSYKHISRVSEVDSTDGNEDWEWPRAAGKINYFEQLQPQVHTYASIFRDHQYLQDHLAKRKHLMELPPQVYGAYKTVDKRVRPIPGVYPENARVTRTIPEDPIASLPFLSPNPPDFVPSGRLTKERLEMMKFNEDKFLTPQEENAFLHVLMLNQRAIAFEDSERGTFRDDYFTPFVYPTIDHVPWAQTNIPIPKGYLEEVIQILQAKIAAGVYEPSQASYRARWFCVKKKDGKLRIVHNLMALNAVSIRTAGTPPNLEEFVEPFAGSVIYTVGDLFSGFDARIVHPDSRDLTTFMTPLGLLRITVMPQGYTNSPAEFQACMSFILGPEMPKANIFIDDLPIAGPKTTYPDENGEPERIPENPGIRRFVWEHLQDVHRVMHRIGHAGGTFSGKKFQIARPEVLIVGHRCNADGRLPDLSRISKVVDWPTPKNARDVRGFLGLAGGVRIWIQGYSKIARPLTELCRKESEFIWDERRQEAFEHLKELVTSAPALRPIDYKCGRTVILAVDTSYIAVGYVLYQLDETGKRRPARYGSLPMNEREARYSQAKLELYGLYRALRDWRIHLAGVKELQIEVDAQYIKGMLNEPDLQPNAAMNRWVAGIHEFDFKLVHVPGVEHKAPDALSRREPAENEYQSDESDWEMLLSPKSAMKNRTSSPRAPETAAPKQYPSTKDKNSNEQPVELNLNRHVKTIPERPNDNDVPMKLATSEAPNEQPVELNQDRHVKTIPERAKDNVPTQPAPCKPPTRPITPNEARTKENLGAEPIGTEESESGEEHVTLTSESDQENRNIPTPPLVMPALIQPPDVRQASAQEAKLYGIRHYLRTLQLPPFPTSTERKRFLKRALQFYVRDGKMYKRIANNSALLVVLDPEKRRELMEQAHEEHGHRGVYAVYETMKTRFYWPFMWKDIDAHVHSCDQCQRRSTRKVEVPLNPATPATLFTKIHVDIMDMPDSKGYRCIIAARDDLTQAAEGRALKNKKAKTVARFLWTQILCRYGAIAQIVTDNGPELMGAFAILVRRYKINHIHISEYNSKANGVVERGHFIIREAILKACDGDPKRWPDKVHHAFFADKCMVRRATGFTPFYLMHGVDPILPFDLAEATFLVEGFKAGMSTEDLLALRIRQLEKRPEDLARAADMLTKSRYQAKDRWERHFARRFLPDGSIQPGTWVLVRNTRIEKSMDRKQYPRYIGPYIVERRTKGGSYVLKEMDGTIDRRGKAAFRILPYIRRRPTHSISHTHSKSKTSVDFSDWELENISDDDDDLQVIKQAEREALKATRQKRIKSRVPRGRRIEVDSEEEEESDTTED